MLLNMKDLLKVANDHNFAVPAFNIGTGQILKAVLETCEELRAPVILAIHRQSLNFKVIFSWKVLNRLPIMLQFRSRSI
jgi:fructose-bisphosphate aldolase class II